MLKHKALGGITTILSAKYLARLVAGALVALSLVVSALLPPAISAAEASDPRHLLDRPLDQVGKIFDTRALLSACLAQSRELPKSVVLSQEQKQCIEKVEKLNQNLDQFVSENGSTCQSCSSNEGRPLVTWFTTPASTPSAARGRLGSPRFDDQWAAFKEAQKIAKPSQALKKEFSQINSFAELIDLYLSETQTVPASLLTADVVATSAKLKGFISKRTGGVFEQELLQRELTVYLYTNVAKTEQERGAVLNRLPLPAPSRLDVLIQLQRHLSGKGDSQQEWTQDFLRAARDLGFTTQIQKVPTESKVGTPQASSSQMSPTQLVLRDGAGTTSYILRSRTTAATQQGFAQPQADLASMGYTSPADGKSYQILAYFPPEQEPGEARQLMVGIVQDPLSQSTFSAGPTAAGGKIGELAFANGTLSLAAKPQKPPSEETAPTATSTAQVSHLPKVVARADLRPTPFLELAAQSEAEDARVTRVATTLQVEAGKVKGTVGHDAQAAKTNLDLKVGDESYALKVGGGKTAAGDFGANLELTLVPQEFANKVKLKGSFGLDKSVQNIELQTGNEKGSVAIRADNASSSIVTDRTTYRAELETEGQTLGMAADIVAAQNPERRLSVSYKNKNRTVEQEVKLEVVRTKDGTDPTLYYGVQIPLR